MALDNENKNFFDVVGTRHVSSQLKAFLPQTKVTAPKIGCVRCGQSRGNGDTRNKPKKRHNAGLIFAIQPKWDKAASLYRDELICRLNDLANQMPMGLLVRLVKDAEEFIAWHKSKKELRRKHRGKKPKGYGRFD